MTVVKKTGIISDYKLKNKERISSLQQQEVLVMRNKAHFFKQMSYSDLTIK